MKITFDESEKDKISAFEKLPDALADIEQIKFDIANLRDADSELNKSIDKFNKIVEQDWSKLEKEWEERVDSFANWNFSNKFNERLNAAKLVLEKVENKEEDFNDREEKIKDLVNEVREHSSNADLCFNWSMFIAILAIIFNISWLIVWACFYWK